ncbi:MAG: DUF305 domain-containing protein [Chloroflexi bacterium]|nr:DUF305 domain-containing protein [Chloroflexota bacterium]
MTLLRLSALTGALLFTVNPSGVSAHSHEGGTSGDFESQQESIQELEGLAGEEFEIAYVNAIVPHHESALEMAQAIVDRAPHQEVRAAAAQIIEDQQSEIGMLTSFLEDTYGVEVEPDERQMMSVEMMAELENATPEMAEAMFLLMMREHHQAAIEIGELGVQKAESDTLIEQAEMMIAMQRDEQERFATWLQDWYGIEAPEPTGDMMSAMEHAGEATMPETSSEPGSGGSSLLALFAFFLALTAVVSGRYALGRKA